VGLGFIIATLRYLSNGIQLVALPYNLLLSSVARKALGIDVTNQIIIIDEAHSTSNVRNTVNLLTP